MLAPLVFQAAWSDDATDIARAASRRTTQTTTPVATRGKQKLPPNTQTNATVSRATANIEPAIKTTTTVRERPQSVSTRTPQQKDTPAPRTTVARTATNTVLRDTTGPARNTTTRGTTARTATPTTITRSSDIVRTTKTPRATPVRDRASVIRSATTTGDTAYQSVTSRDYKKCRDIFYNCMDEFCASKDSLLKRCACSSRIHEFDNVKKQMERVEEKLLDFSQRLLTVNMDAEDALALNTATEGELAYNQDDKSDSKKMLDEIAKKLNTTFDDTSFNQGLNAISLSLNTDAAFDNVDSLLGASTTTKTGTDLYAAALPICREMVLEVCSDEDLKITESGYQMSIEQDCNTVAKSYQTQTEQARTKIFESGALLDMSRLDVHQKRNSDDILTCKQKMLNMLTDNSVCGSDMTKCLDTTGRYIDPTTGEAFLTDDLYLLSTLISRPEANQTWTNAPGNERFVSFLNSKKLFLEPAMEKCQDISDTVWQDFIEDALAQIKLAQDKKLEEIRQSCTTLTFQCLDDTMDSLADFDARALSIFGVSAIKTAAAMCADVQTACTALLNATDSGTSPNTESSWSTGITGVITDKTYETILSTCRTVGQNCIIQTCKNTSGNFGLCEDKNSIHYKNIIDRTACWQEVLDCVTSASDEFFANYYKKYTNSAQQNIIQELYGQELYGQEDISYDLVNTPCPKGTTNSTHDICNITDPSQTTKRIECTKCLLAERIWGHCFNIEDHSNLGNGEIKHIGTNIGINSDNKENETLLSWFARNTKNTGIQNNCYVSRCKYDQIDFNGDCKPRTDFTTDGEFCPVDSNKRFYATGNITNCCPTETFTDVCCASDLHGNTIQTDIQLCMSQNEYTPMYTIQEGDKNLGFMLCLGTLSDEPYDNNSESYPDFPSGTKIYCDGTILYTPTKTDSSILSQLHRTPSCETNNKQNEGCVENFYITNTSGTECVYVPKDKKWLKSTGDTCDTPTKWQIRYK